MPGVDCQSCGKPKQSVEHKESKLIPGMFVNLCADCIKHQYEPRFIVILAANSPQRNKAAAYIKQRRYVGEEIPAVDVL